MRDDWSRREGWILNRVGYQQLINRRNCLKT